jgi:hypothetical protein
MAGIILAAMLDTLRCLTRWTKSSDLVCANSVAEFDREEALAIHVQYEHLDESLTKS